jgi:hypothetical protein
MSESRCNDIPPCNIWVDKDGVWYYEGAEMFRMDIVNLFYKNLKRDDSGRYIIEMANDRCYIEVEDTPYVVKAVYKFNSNEMQRESLHILLNNADLDELDVTTLKVGKDNVLYCSVKNKTFDARFSRAGYYQIADFIEYDEEKDLFYISLNNNSIYIKTSQS